MAKPNIVIVMGDWIVRATLYQPTTLVYNSIDNYIGRSLVHECIDNVLQK